MNSLIQQISTMSAPMFWLVVLIISAILEGATAALVSIWFIGGALIALLLSFTGIPFGIQVGCFLVVSIILLIFTRPIIKKYLHTNETKTNIDMLIGKQAKVVETIDNKQSTGAVYVDGKTWTARSNEDNTIIEKDNMVEIVKIEGVKLIVNIK